MLMGFSAALPGSGVGGEAERDVWDLATADTRIQVSVSADRPVVRQLSSTASPYDWANGGMAVPLMSRVWLGQREIATKWVFERGKRDRRSGRLILTFRNEEPRLRLRSVWRARAGRGPVEHWLEIENQSGERVTVSYQDSLSLRGLTPGGTAHLWWIRRGGSNASSEGGTFTEMLDANLDLNLVSNCADGASPVPWMAVQVGEERGLYVGWEFSGVGRVRARASSDGAGLDVDIGNLPDFKTDIDPGETLLVPPAFVGCYAGDIEEGSYSLHRWVIEKLRPRFPKGLPDPVLAYNVYFDGGGTEAGLLRCAANCRDLGFEVFMPDAMWFPATGDWRWDKSRFPTGVAPIEEYIHANGMKMALWCAWTHGGASEHPEALSVRGPAAHPDWFNAPPNYEHENFLCLAGREGKQWAIHKTQALVKDNKLDYLKHDGTLIVTTCDKSTHRHRYGTDVSYWAAMGYYEVQEKLRQAFPDLILENCSGGGHIKDFGVIQRAHYTVTTDNLSALPNRQSIYDSTYALPPLVLQAYTVERFFAPEGDDPRPYLWRSAMMGAWQIDPKDSRSWTDAEREQTKLAVGTYKDWIRPILQDVKVHHVLPRPDGIHWDGMFYWSPKLKKGTLYIFRPKSDVAQQTVKLKGLDRDGRYWVWSQDGAISSGIQSGADLMTVGLTIALPGHYTSDLILVQDASLGKPLELVVRQGAS